MNTTAPGSPGTHLTDVTRRSDRELVVTRTFDGPARLVYEGVDHARIAAALVDAEGFGIAFISCEADVRPAAATASSLATRNSTADGLRPLS